MVTAITQNIKISVKTAYQSDESIPKANRHIFAYRISIENNGLYTIQLLRRHWFIFDANGSYREVEGKGVIGEQPVLEPGENYQYTSACFLETEIGQMYGTFLMARLIDDAEFTVRIPAFQMLVPYLLN